MAADDLLTVHEELEQTTGINWQVLYLPAFVIGAATAGAVPRAAPASPRHVAARRRRGGLGAGAR
jgi:hypothetical protein